MSRFADLLSLVPALVIPPQYLDAVGFYGCTVHQPLGLAPLYWGASLTFETIALALLVYRIFELRRQSGSLPILNVLLRHGAFYFMVVFVAGLVNILMSASRLVLSLHASKDKLTLSTHAALSRQSLHLAHSFSPREPTNFDKIGDAFSAHATAPLHTELSDLSGSTILDDPISAVPGSPVDEKDGSTLTRTSTRIRYAELPTRPAPSHPHSPLHLNPYALSSSRGNPRRPSTAPSRLEPRPRPAPAPRPPSTPFPAQPRSRFFLRGSNSSSSNGAALPRSVSFEDLTRVQQETTVTVEQIAVADADLQGGGLDKGREVWTGEGL
ncbi:hypothetical protein JCM11641_001418 [Rhodosporidiobolus odoratus]